MIYVYVLVIVIANRTARSDLVLLRVDYAESAAQSCSTVRLHADLILVPDVSVWNQSSHRVVEFQAGGRAGRRTSIIIVVVVVVAFLSHLRHPLGVLVHLTYRYSTIALQ